MDPRKAQLLQNSADRKRQKETEDLLGGLDIGTMALDPDKVGKVEAEQRTPVPEEDRFDVETAMLHAISKSGFMRNPQRNHVQWEALWNDLKEILGPYIAQELVDQIEEEPEEPVADAVETEDAVDDGFLPPPPPAPPRTRRKRAKKKKVAKKPRVTKAADGPVEG